MPYVNKDFRSHAQHHDGDVSLDYAIDELCNELRKHTILNRAGMCNYVITKIVAKVMKPHEGWRYYALNAAHGTFFSAAAEFYRRLVAPYEEKCITENGDIPEYQE